MPAGGPAGRNMASTLKTAVKAPTTIPTLTHQGTGKRPLRPVITAPLAPGHHHDISVATMAGTRVRRLGGGTNPVRYESLEADENSRIDRKIDPVKSIVNVGDAVVEVRGNEFEGLTSFG